MNLPKTVRRQAALVPISGGSGLPSMIMMTAPAMSSIYDKLRMSYGKLEDVCVGDIQIDDLVSNLNPAIPIRILFPAYHNKKVSDEKLKELGIIRAGYDYHTVWQEVCKILLESELKWLK